jgi:hypothetical protein
VQNTSCAYGLGLFLKCEIPKFAFLLELQEAFNQAINMKIQALREANELWHEVSSSGQSNPLSPLNNTAGSGNLFYIPFALLKIPPEWFWDGFNTVQVPSVCICVQVRLLEGVR